MFGQKKKKAQFNMMGDSRVTCYDFIRRFDELFESYRAADYKLYHRLSEEEMRPKLDQHLEDYSQGMSMMLMEICLIVLFWLHTENLLLI